MTDANEKTIASDKTALWDAIIVGGGAAGLSTALLLGRARRRVLILDTGEPRNRFAAHMHGVLGFDGAAPGEYLARGRAELGRYDVTVRPAAVTRVIDGDDGTLTVITATGERLRARRLVVASGITDVLPDIPGLSARWGRDVLHCPYCHGWEVRGARFGVLATSPQAVHQAQLVRQWSDDVTLFCTEPLPEDVRAGFAARGVAVETRSVAAILTSADALSGVRLSDGTVVAVDVLFTAGRPQPHDGFLADLHLGREDGPFGSLLSVTPGGRTSHPLIWAVGNVVAPMATVPMVTGAGATVAGEINRDLVAEEFAAAVAARC